MTEVKSFNEWIQTQGKDAHELNALLNNCDVFSAQINTFVKDVYKKNYVFQVLFEKDFFDKEFSTFNVYASKVIDNNRGRNLWQKFVISKVDPSEVNDMIVSQVIYNLLCI